MGRSHQSQQDLKKVRNVKPLWSKLGLIGGLALGGLDMWTNQLFGFSVFGTIGHDKNDADSTGKAADYPVIEYPRNPMVSCRSTG